jgi:site-specific recombinase XerD
MRRHNPGWAVTTIVADRRDPDNQPRSPRLLDQVRAAIRVRGYSRRTEKAYVAWVRRFVRFHGTRHPCELGEAEVTRFLTHLAVDRKVSASTQNQALSALLFLYRDVLRKELSWLDDVVQARQPARPRSRARRRP